MSDGLVPDTLGVIRTTAGDFCCFTDFSGCHGTKTMPGTEPLTLQTSNALSAQRDTHAKGAAVRPGRSLSHEEIR